MSAFIRVFTQRLLAQNPAAAHNRANLLRSRRSVYPSGSRNIWFSLNMNMSPTLPPPPPPPIVMKRVVNDDEETAVRDNFRAAFPGIVKDLTDTKRYLDMPEVSEWVTKLLQYNVIGGKMDRGITLVLSYKMLSPKSELYNENFKLIYIMGWCIEILQTFQLMMDDIMDGALTRRGHLCWHRHKEIDLIAVNDGILLEQAIYRLLYKYFKDKPYYTYILDLFHNVTMKSAMGQCLDMLTANSFKVKKFEKFTLKNYDTIAKYKTAYYSFFLPVTLSMIMTNMNDPEIVQKTKIILLKMGHLFQVQDDFLDCYGHYSTTGKMGKDIEDGKCSWLAVVALQKANPQQKIIMEKNYGLSDPANVAVIRRLYEELEIPKTFHRYEEENYNMIHTDIQQLPHGSSQNLFFKFLKKMYKRSF